MSLEDAVLQPGPTPLQPQKELLRRSSRTGGRRGTPQTPAIQPAAAPAAAAATKPAVVSSSSGAPRPTKPARRAAVAAAGRGASSQAGSSNNSSDNPAAANDAEQPAPMCAFEAERAARIAANMARLAALELPQLAADLAASVPRRPASKRPPPARGISGRGNKRRSGEQQLPVRQSARRRGEAPDPATAGGIASEGRDGRVVLAAAAAAGRGRSTPASSGTSSSGAIMAAAPPGPLPIRSSNGDEATDAAFVAMLAALVSATGCATATTTTTSTTTSSSNRKLKPGSGAGGTATGSDLSQLQLDPADVAKMTKDGVTCLAFHPSTSKLVIAAADKSGKVGLWDVDHTGAGCEGGSSSSSSYDGVLVFEPHRDYISSLKWLGSGGQLLSGSYDGLVRRLDLEAGVWDLVAGLPDDAAEVGWSAGDATADGAALFLATSEGGLTLADTRTASSSPGLVIANRKVNTLHLHSNGIHLASAASDGCVAVWDVRQLASSSSSSSKPRHAKPVCQLHHTKSSQGAYWAPDGSSRLLSISFDDTLKVWADPAGPAAAAGAAGTAGGTWKPKLELAVSIRHNNNTGRWVVPFRPAWSPAADAVMVGDMKRGVALFSVQQQGSSSSAAAPLGLLQADALTAIPSRLALHPSGSINCFAAATSSGRVHIWR